MEWSFDGVRHERHTPKITEKKNYKYLIRKIKMFYIYCTWQGTQRIGLLSTYFDKILAAPIIRQTTHYTLKGKNLFLNYFT
jgi:hypothetical protein